MAALTEEFMSIFICLRSEVCPHSYQLHVLQLHMYAPGFCMRDVDASLTSMYA